MSFAAFSYLAAALAAAGLFLLTLAAHRVSLLGRRLLVVAAITTLWAALLAAVAFGIRIPGPAVDVANGLRYSALFVLLAYLTTPRLPAWLQRMAAVLCLAMLACGAAPAILATEPGLGALFIHVVPRIELLLAFTGLVLIEQLYRGADIAKRAALWPFAIGIGGQFAYDLFLTAQAELFGGIEAISWGFRGLVIAALVPFLVLGARRLSEHRERVFVSRHVVFYSTAILAMGVYFLGMAIGGYYVRLLGGNWGPALQLLFLLGAAAVLASVLVQGGLWRRIKVFIATHFYRNKFDYRVEWLRFIRTLSSPDNHDIGVAAVRAVAQIFASPGGVLLLRNAGSDAFQPYRSWPESLTGRLPAQAVPAGHELPGFLAERQWIIDLVEYRRQPQLYGDVSLPEWILEAKSVRIIVPLLTLNRLDGMLLLEAPPEPFTMNFEDHDFLKTLGRHLAVHIGQHVADQQLAEARQFDTYNRLAAFVMHDLKNSVAQLQLLVSNAAKHRNNPEFFDDAIDTIANAVDRMTRLIEQLRTPEAAGQVREVELATIVQQAVDRARQRQPAPQLDEGLSAAMVKADPDRLGAVLDHVLRNAQDAVTADGSVSVAGAVNGQHVTVTVTDDGIGMAAEFVRDRLFRPFDSTKGSKGMGIGAYQAREYVRYLGGDVEVQSSPGQGTHFSITLPLCQTPSQNS